jgi:hypothetical protein
LQLSINGLLCPFTIILEPNPSENFHSIMSWHIFSLFCAVMCSQLNNNWKELGFSVCVKAHFKSQLVGPHPKSVWYVRENRFYFYFFNVPPSVFWAILCSSQSGDDPQDNLVKFGYKLNMKIIFQNILLYFWLPTWTMYRNLAISLWVAFKHL